MNNECNICHTGTIELYQYSLDKAIQVCSNDDCTIDSDKWPWELICASPMLNDDLVTKWKHILHFDAPRRSSNASRATSLASLADQELQSFSEKFETINAAIGSKHPTGTLKDFNSQQTAQSPPSIVQILPTNAQSITGETDDSPDTDTIMKDLLSEFTLNTSSAQLELSQTNNISVSEQNMESWLECFEDIGLGGETTLESGTPVISCDAVSHKPQNTTCVVNTMQGSSFLQPEEVFAVEENIYTETKSSDVVESMPSLDFSETQIGHNQATARPLLSIYSTQSELCSGNAEEHIHLSESELAVETNAKQKSETKNSVNTNTKEVTSSELESNKRPLSRELNSVHDCDMANNYLSTVKPNSEINGEVVKNKKAKPRKRISKQTKVPIRQSNRVREKKSAFILVTKDSPEDATTDSHSSLKSPIHPKPSYESNNNQRDPWSVSDFTVDHVDIEILLEERRKSKVPAKLNLYKPVLMEPELLDGPQIPLEISCSPITNRVTNCTQCLEGNNNKGTLSRFDACKKHHNVPGKVPLYFKKILDGIKFNENFLCESREKSSLDDSIGLGILDSESVSGDSCASSSGVDWRSPIDDEEFPILCIDPNDEVHFLSLAKTPKSSTPAPHQPNHSKSCQPAVKRKRNSQSVDLPRKKRPPPNVDRLSIDMSVPGFGSLEGESDTRSMPSFSEAVYENSAEVSVTPVSPSKQNLISYDEQPAATLLTIDTSPETVSFVSKSTQNLDELQVDMSDKITQSILQRSGWAVEQGDPTINYVDSSLTLPTAVPFALQHNPTEAISSVVNWNLASTNYEVEEMSTKSPKPPTHVKPKKMSVQVPNGLVRPLSKVSRKRRRDTSRLDYLKLKISPLPELSSDGCSIHDDDEDVSASPPPRKKPKRTPTPPLAGPQHCDDIQLQEKLTTVLSESADTPDSVSVYVNGQLFVCQRVDS